MAVGGGNCRPGARRIEECRGQPRSGQGCSYTAGGYGWAPAGAPGSAAVSGVGEVPGWPAVSRMNRHVIIPIQGEFAVWRGWLLCHAAGSRLDRTRGW
jgi:hypothetical protein